MDNPKHKQVHYAHVPITQFYIYANVANLTDDSAHLCQRLLEEAGVALTPGTDFDPVRGKFYVRFSFSGTYADIKEGAIRLVNWHKMQI